jgi:CRISPR-associated endonuclease Csy4
MKYYIEISLIKQQNLSYGQLWSNLYEKLHVILVKFKNVENVVNIGFTFPEYKFNSDKDFGILGNKLRIFANTDNELTRLNLNEELNILSEYIYLTAIKLTPSELKGYVLFKRKQFKTNIKRLARRNSIRNNTDYNLTINKYQNIIYKTNLPFINFSSKTNNNKFKLFLIKQSVNTVIENKCIFNTYGLSFDNNISFLPDF